MRMAVWVIVLALMAGIGLRPVQAQPGDAPLLVTLDGTLYAVTDAAGPLEPVMPGGLSFFPVTSPDGTSIVYTHNPASAAYTDIWRYDVATGQVQPLTVQPLTAQPGSGESPVLRNRPVWSSDGRWLIWYEVEGTFEAGYTVRVVLLDVETGTTRIAPDVPGITLDADMTHMPDTYWIGTGFGMLYGTISPEAALLRYGLDGELQGNLPLSNFLIDGGITDGVVPVWDGDRETIGLHFQAYDQWDLVDPVSLEWEPVTDGIVERYSLLAPDTSLALRADSLDESLVILAPEGTELERLPGVSVAALSPDGQRVAYVGADAVYIWQAGQAVTVAGTEFERPARIDLAWGPEAWRVRHDPALAAAVEDQRPVYGVETCYADAALVAGARGRITQDVTFFQYTDPLRAAGGTFHADDIYTVLDGPVCVDVRSPAWWLIDVNGTSGWVTYAETTERIPYLTLTQCPGGPPSRLTQFTTVSTPHTVTLYDQPAADGPVLRTIPAAAQVRVTVPRCAGDRLWWRARYEDEWGWIMERELID